MADILDQIIADKRIEIALAKERLSETDIHKLWESKASELEKYHPSLKAALTANRNLPLGGTEGVAGAGIISEFKRKSPSKGWIKEEGRADIIPISYQQNGAAALSILTDEKYFGGKDEFILAARHSGVTIPILYKNFVVDEYQLFQAALCGASAVLLIAADLKKSECKALLQTAHELGLEVLLEMHSEEELEYVELEPDVCGINNRNLGSFVTDVQNSFRLSELLPKDAVKVSESGISNPETVKLLIQAGFNGFLIGENFMKTPNPGDALKEFINNINN